MIRWIAILVGAAALLLLLVPTAQGQPPLTRQEPIVRMVLQEAVGEPYDGQVTVAGVALDRMGDDRWPGTADAVVRQPWQFTGMMARLGEYKGWEILQARAAVAHARAGYRPCGGGAYWYHSSSMIWPGWAMSLGFRCMIGGHIFYGDRK